MVIVIVFEPVPEAIPSPPFVASTGDKYILLLVESKVIMPPATV
jgi:hypothetical protein